MIVLTASDADSQVLELLQQYPKLSLMKSDASCIRLQGEIDVYRTASNFTLDRVYSIEVRIPVDSADLPTVSDLGGAIDTSYPHRYTSGALCLETDAAIRLRFIDGFNLTKWVEEYVESYYFSYEYYMRFGAYPFGERPHGIEGIFSTYQDLFQETDIKTLWALLQYCADKNYHGHINCPCGSMKRLRQCHGKILFPIMTDSRKKEVIQMDVEVIRNALTRKN